MELLNSGDVPEYFDAVVIDAAQDFGSQFFRLCYQSLKQPKRLIWGYDEVQSLDELNIPTSEDLFGPDSDGNPFVNLDGTYPGDVEKDMILYHCNRNPRPILIAAHAFGLGLRRKGGPLQFIDTVAGWQDIGYEIRGSDSNQLVKGKEVTRYRPESNSPHLLEKLAGYHNLLQVELFENREKELDWIIEDVIKNIIEEELRPEEIAIIILDGRRRFTDPEYERLYEGLAENEINSIRVGTNSSIDNFRAEGAVTITSIYRAKGNEASIIYVYGFEKVGKGYGPYDAIVNRNRAFPAMTRTKGWLVSSGTGKVAQQLFREIESILETIESVSFVVPDMETIKRNLETYEYQRRRQQIKKAEKSMKQTIRILMDVDREGISPEVRDTLLRLLRTQDDNDKKQDTS